jgi:hypothetical protein
VDFGDKTEEVNRMPRKTVNLSGTTHQKLCDYADNKKLKNLEKALESLLKQSEEIERLKSENEKLKTQQPQQPITSDVPPGMPLNPEKQAALDQLKQEHYEVQELPLPQCNYAAKGRIDHKLGYQLVICNDPKKYKKPTEIPLPACQNCWTRREWWKEKREQETEDRTIGQLEPEPPDCSLRNLNYKGAEKDPNAVHNFRKGENRLGYEGKMIYCTYFGDFKSLQFCLDCFKGGKSSSVSTDVAETEELGDVE